MNPIKHNLITAFKMLRDPWKTLEEVESENAFNTFTFLLTIGAVTALLTTLQIYLGFEDINGLHAGDQAEYLARDLSALCRLGIEWRPLLIEILYIFILLFSTVCLHIILIAVGGRGSIGDTFRMIAYGDTPGLLFGWIPYFATVSAVWAAAIQLLIGPVAVHKITWGKATIIFGMLVGLGVIEIALS